MSRNARTAPVEPAQGLESAPLKSALDEALTGRTTRLEDLLSRHGAILRATPNLKLGAAFAAELAAAPAGPAQALLARFAEDDAAPDDPRCFLPVAAALGFGARVAAHLDGDASWTALLNLAADERAPVRVGAREALLGIAVRPGGVDNLIARAHAWLSDEDEGGAADAETRFGTTATVLESIGDKRALSGVRDEEALLAWLDRAIDEIVGASRSEERSDARRRLLAAMPRAFVATVAASSGTVRTEWLARVCTEARHLDLRAVLSDTVVKLQNGPHGLSAAAVSTLRTALSGSAQPLRHADRVRPGHGRGKATRRMR